MSKSWSRGIKLCKLDENGNHKYTHVLIMDFLYLCEGKEYAITKDDLLYNIIENIDNENFNEYQKIDEYEDRLKKQLHREEEFIIKFIKDDIKNNNIQIEKIEDNINIIYTTFPLYVDLDNCNESLSLKKIAIAEVELKSYKYSRKTYIFSDVEKYLKFIENQFSNTI